MKSVIYFSINNNRQWHSTQKHFFLDEFFEICVRLRKNWKLSLSLKQHLYVYILQTITRVLNMLYLCWLGLINEATHNVLQVCNLRTDLKKRCINVCLETLNHKSWATGQFVLAYLLAFCWNGFDLVLEHNNIRSTQTNPPPPNIFLNNNK